MSEERTDMWVQVRHLAAFPGRVAASVPERGKMSRHHPDPPMSSQVPVMRRSVNIYFRIYDMCGSHGSDLSVL